jgi:DNA replication protein DnaC
LGLFGMAKAFGEAETSAETAALTHLEWLALLLDREMTYRHDKKLAARLRYARLRQQVLVEDVDYRATRGLDRPLFQKLVTGDWIDAHDNLIVCGPTGIGKSWLACALGHKACRDNRSVLYHRLPRLFDALALARGDGRHARLLKTLSRVDLLILDDWGLVPVTLDQARDLLEIIDDRHGRGSTIVTTQLPIEHWHEMIPNPTIADAILDRLVHNAHRLTLKGESMRKTAAKNAGLDGKQDA